MQSRMAGITATLIVAVSAPLGTRSVCEHRGAERRSFERWTAPPNGEQVAATFLTTKGVGPCVLEGSCVRREPFLRSAWRLSSLAPIIAAMAVGLVIVVKLPSAQASVGFSSTWEQASTGDDPPAPWDGYEDHGTFTSGYSASNELQIISSDGAIRPRQGSKFAKFIVNPGDAYGGSTGERSLARWMGPGESEGQDAPRRLVDVVADLVANACGMVDFCRVACG